MQLLKQFEQLKYDASASRVPMIVILGLFVIVIFVLQSHEGMTVNEGGLFLLSVVLFCLMIWFAVPIYNKIKSFYFAIQGFFIAVGIFTIADFYILMLITFGAFLLIQSFYFYRRMRQFLLYLIGYLAFGSLILYQSYGADEVKVYLLLFILSLVIVFLVLTIFNQKELENMALMESNERIELLTRQNERQRMARDLHDSLIQKLIALNLKMDVIDVHVKKGHHKKAEKVLEMAKQQIGESIVEARQVVEDLRLNMEDLHFKEQLYEEVYQLQYVYNLPIDLKIQLKREPSQQLGNNIVAIVKEAITNVHKHANAKTVRVQLREKGDMYQLIIADDGVGIDVKQALQLDKHYGLLGMQERVALFDGSFSVISECGTKIMIQFPLKRSEMK